jgi:hypothetical protein
VGPKIEKFPANQIAGKNPTEKSLEKKLKLTLGSRFLPRRLNSPTVGVGGERRGGDP